MDIPTVRTAQAHAVPYVRYRTESGLDSPEDFFMSARLGSTSVRETPDLLKAELGYCTVTEIAELYRTLAVTCVQKQTSRVLIVTGDDDPAGERALRDALTVMVLAGLPAHFRLALVVTLPRAARIYGNTERDLNAAGIRSRLFDKEEEAVLWLDGEGRGARMSA